MKCHLLIFTLNFFLAPCFAQNFSLSELIKFNNIDYDEFDTYVSKRGYIYYKNSSDENTEVLSYVYHIDKFRKSFISKFNQKHESENFISYQTNNTSVYLKIKSELKTLSFKYIDNREREGTTFFNYKKGLIKVILASYIDEHSDGQRETQYEISVVQMY